MKRTLSIIAIIATICAIFVFATACNDSPSDNTSDAPQYSYINGELVCFTLELRAPSSTTSTEGNTRPHSALDGNLICSWQVPYYGNTVYEAVQKFFEDRTDNIDFRLSQYKFQMFHSCTLENGSEYNLERAYVAADGKYSMCANYQMLLGDDNVLGTVDDLAVLVVVYDGWMY